MNRLRKINVSLRYPRHNYPPYSVSGGYQPVWIVVGGRLKIVWPSRHPAGLIRRLPSMVNARVAAGDDADKNLKTSQRLLRCDRTTDHDRHTDRSLRHRIRRASEM